MERVVSIRGVVFDVPAISKSEGKAREIELEMADLTGSSMGVLRQNDPFMYYSIFSPASYPIDWPTEFHAFLVQRRCADIDGASRLKVQRQTRISAECDDATFVLRNVLGESVKALGSDEYSYESGNEGEKELVED